MGRHFEALDIAENILKHLQDDKRWTKACEGDGKVPLLLFIVYVERSTDAAANEKAREKRETPDVL